MGTPAFDATTDPPLAPEDTNRVVAEVKAVRRSAAPVELKAVRQVRVITDLDAESSAMRAAALRALDAAVD